MSSDNSLAAKILHPLLALIASASNKELARYVEFLKEENKIQRARVPGQIHTRSDERWRLVKLGKALGQAIEELITLVTPSTFYCWCLEADAGKKKAISKGSIHGSAVESGNRVRRLAHRIQPPACALCRCVSATFPGLKHETAVRLQILLLSIRFGSA